MPHTLFVLVKVLIYKLLDTSAHLHTFFGIFEGGPFLEGVRPSVFILPGRHKAYSWATFWHKL